MLLHSFKGSNLTTAPLLTAASTLSTHCQRCLCKGSLITPETVTALLKPYPILKQRLQKLQLNSGFWNLFERNQFERSLRIWCALGWLRLFSTEKYWPGNKSPQAKWLLERQRHNCCLQETAYLHRDCCRCLVIFLCMMEADKARGRHLLLQQNRAEQSTEQNTNE